MADRDIFQNLASYSKLEPLSNDEIEEFFNNIDTNGDGWITFEQLERKLEEVHREIAPEAQQHHLHHPQRRFPTRENVAEPPDLEKGVCTDPDRDALQAFLRALMPRCSNPITKEEFVQHVRSWNIPSPTMTSVQSADAKDEAFVRRLSWSRRIRAHWSVDGPRIIFLAFIFVFTTCFCLWQGLAYNYDKSVRAAFGWGVVLAKFCTGAIYPVLFFTILSMSRWFSTIMRRFHLVSRLVDWDYSQWFHIWMACIGLVAATMHAVGHLAGTFFTGSRPSHQIAVEEYFGPEQTPVTYASFLRRLPGWSGVVALTLYWIMALLSLPPVRRWSYQLFQLGHLLMFPLLGLLCAHGTAKILHYPMLGFWLAIPFLMVILERSLRVIRGFYRLRARLEVLDNETVCITVKHAKHKNWDYRAGQYVFLQVPVISFFQWHPFTISACMGDQLQLHIKTDGDWTRRLRGLSTIDDIRVGIDGPFGAPAQRFYDFDRTLIIGTGIGISPFSAIITDLEQHLVEQRDPWVHSRRSSTPFSRKQSACNGTRSSSSSSASSTAPTSHSNTSTPSIQPPPPALLIPAAPPPRHRPSDNRVPTRRRVDFHWIVRDKTYLLWFSTLLNRAHDLSQAIPRSTLELNIATHITTKGKSISTHIFPYLLDSYRTESSPISALTGLKTRSRFGRPDFEKILTDFYNDEVGGRERERERGGKSGRIEEIGVFFCGSPKIGRILSDVCVELTARARREGSKVRFLFMMEVFG